MQFLPVMTAEAAYHKATHVAVVTHEDLTEATANTAQTIPLFTAAANSAVRLVKMILKVAFKDASDAAFNNVAITLGDSGDVDRLLPSTQINENGTEVDFKQGTIGGNIAAVATADGSDAGTTQALANALKVAFNALVAQINAGPNYVYTSATVINLIVNSMAAKSLSDIDTGVLELYFDIQQ
jgi:hypothetical protein